eukprot:TRINITY_DN2554_c0_g2_i1.p1 TRINITY_DN2554_c0_g2~~TRINITY_DN2554_c0_g2_i1.p1  ORF type:complete len:421 (-),score=87.84 TRINITY_DN2554_c0_g2_i1:27-1289(-)
MCLFPSHVDISFPNFAESLREDLKKHARVRMRSNFFFLWISSQNSSQWIRISDTATLRNYLPHSEMIWAVCFLPTNKKNSPTFTSALTGDENLFFDMIRGETPKRRFTCSYCHQEGHSRRTCPNNPNRVNELEQDVHQSLYNSYSDTSVMGGEMNLSSNIFSDNVGGSIMNSGDIQDYAQYVNNLMPILEKINKSKCGTSECFIWAALIAANLHNSYEIPPWYLITGFNGDKHRDLCPLLVPNEIYEHVLINLTEMLNDPTSQINSNSYSIPSLSSQYFDSHSDNQIVTSSSVSPDPSASFTHFNSISKMSSFSNSMSRPVDNLDSLNFNSNVGSNSPSLLNSSFVSLNSQDMVVNTSNNELSTQSIPFREITPPPLSIVEHIIHPVQSSTSNDSGFFRPSHSPSINNVPSLKMVPVELV